jgi:hypothetical protein
MSGACALTLYKLFYILLWYVIQSMLIPIFAGAAQPPSYYSFYYEDALCTTILLTILLSRLLSLLLLVHEILPLCNFNFYTGQSYVGVYNPPPNTRSICIYMCD